MKGIHASKKLLFINLLWLLWLPNYCDIKQNEGDSQGIPVHETVFSDPSRTENISPKQEEENYIPSLKISEKKVIVQPNVEYVNSVDKEVKVEKIEVASLKSPQSEKLSEEIIQQLHVKLESSRVSSIKSKDRVSMLSKRTGEYPDQPKPENTEIYVAKSKAIKPTLSAPIMETSEPVGKLSSRLGETVPKSSIPDTVEVDLLLARKGRVPDPPLVEADKPVLDDHLHPQTPYDGMPSFDEWKKMMLAEQEKGGQKVPSPTTPGKKISSQKRRRNYSSYECGAKIVASNAEAEGTSRILNELVDEYMLNPCKAKIWFVIELCETVQASQIELANFELFSSCPKDFTVYSSDNFPTRDWAPLGTFTAAEQRNLQSFELKQEGFGKFIKIELQSYYGKEHYCPLSVVRIFGTSMVDEYEEMETLASHSIIQDDELDRLDISLEDKKTTNIFGSATDAVIHIMKKAAQALGQHQPQEDSQINETIPDQQNVSETKVCKLVENSSDECVDVPIKAKSDDLPRLQNFSLLPSSVHLSLFRLLHRCDQCVSSQIRYYSTDQPHCRFFQAAFGPVIFQGLCDWFREHPPVFAHESSAHRKETHHDSDPLIPSPTKSPPPQIMIVPVEEETPIKELVNDTSSHDPLEDSYSLNVTDSNDDVIYSSDELPKGFQLESSIMPTHAQKAEHTIMLNSSVVIVDSSQILLPSSDRIQELPRRPTIVIPNETDALLDKTAVDSIETSVTDPTLVSDVFTDAEEEQMKEYMLDNGSLTTEDMALADVVSSGKPAEDKDSRMDFPGKLEPVVVSGASTAGQKESVFMRMSNRIKALELNMSLSSQYLQELSQRYRRQMEDMQRAFNRTIGTLNDTARKAAERDIRQQEILNSLQIQVANLTEIVEMLLNERSSMYQKMLETHVFLMVVECIVMVTVMSLCVRRSSSFAGQVHECRCNCRLAQPQQPTVVATPRLSKRRSSVDSCTPPVARKVKKRSASEEALNAGEELLIIEPLPVFLDPILKQAKKKNRKRSKVQRSVSNPTVQRRDLSPSGEKRISYSEGCMLKNSRTKPQVHRKNHACENCNEDTCTEAKSAEKDRKPTSSSPLQNLTNGTNVSYQKPPVRSQRLEKGKEKFSFKKFLKFQKRDSI